jgi:hypothetical protein
MLCTNNYRTYSFLSACRGIERKGGDMIGSERERGGNKKRKRNIEYALVGRCASHRIAFGSAVGTWMV